MKSIFAQAALLIGTVMMISTAAHARTFDATLSECERELKTECRDHGAVAVADSLAEGVNQWSIRQNSSRLTIGNASFDTSSGTGLCTININDGQ